MMKTFAQATHRQTARMHGPLPRSASDGVAVRNILHAPRARQAAGATILRTVDRQGGDAEWGAAISCTPEEMFNDPEAFLAHDPPWGCCTDMALAEVRRHFDTARQHINRAIERMTRRARMDGSIRRHFGDMQIWSYDTILRNLEQIRPFVDYGRHDILCRPHSSEVIGCQHRTSAMASAGGPITLCVDSPDTETGTMSGEPGETRFVRDGWNTVLHEVLHVTGIADLPVRREHDGDATEEQEARGEVEVYRGEVAGETGAFSYPGPYSLRNADSYARFIEEVGAESWAEESESAWRWVPQPGVTLGGVLTEDYVQPVVAARLTLTGIGPGLQFISPTLGVSGVWIPGVGVLRDPPPPGMEPPAAEPQAFVGGEGGFRIGVPGPVSFVFDFSVGAGARWSGPDFEPDFALYPRVAPSLRFGSPDLGGNLGIDFGRLFTFADQAEDQWILGISGGVHWGGSAGAPR